jgi:hypothetical protein
LQEIPNVSLDATTAGAKTKPAAVGELRNNQGRESWRLRARTGRKASRRFRRKQYKSLRMLPLNGRGL